MNESSYTRALNSKIDRDKVHVWKISDDYAGGVADVCYMSETGSGKIQWSEFKLLKDYPARHFTPKLSPLQKEWLRKRYDANINVNVVIGLPHPHVLVLESPDEWENKVTRDIIEEKKLTKRDFITQLEARLQ